MEKDFRFQKKDEITRVPPLMARQEWVIHNIVPKVFKAFIAIQLNSI